MYDTQEYAREIEGQSASTGGALDQPAGDLSGTKEGGRARFRAQAFVFADVEVDANRVPWVWQMVGALARGGELHVAAWLGEVEEPWAVRLERLAGALAG